jgi:SAM-dependent methyltransferase
MYERTGRYYALFGPAAVTTPAEEEFLGHWSAGRTRALDLGAGLCGPASVLARLGLDVLAFEPCPVLAALALDRLARGSEVTGRVTLVEGEVGALDEPFRADLILMRSVWMLVDDEARRVALKAMRHHAAPGAVLIIDARTAALDWAEREAPPEEKRIGHTVYRRSTRYRRLPSGATEVNWVIDIERFGRRVESVEESFVVRADTPSDLGDRLRRAGFAIERTYQAYDLAAPFVDGAAMLVAVAVDAGRHHISH